MPPEPGSPRSAAPAAAASTEAAAATAAPTAADPADEPGDATSHATSHAPSPAATLADLGWDAGRDAEMLAHPEATSTSFPGRVARVERGLVRILAGPRTVAVPATDLAVGDWVLVDGQRAVRLARRTELRRKSSDQTADEQVLAANVDVVVVVEPMDPRPSLRRVERMVTLAWASGATPLVVLTKADLGSGEELADVQGVAVGIPVLAVSAEDGTGVAALREHLLPGMTYVLLGPSGAGKSTLVNALVGETLLVTGDVRGDGRGRHTTTHRELVTVPGMASLIDTPGIRGVGLVADSDGLDHAFEDVVALAQECRFSDCSHLTEPGCAVLDGVETGRLDAARLASYRHLLREIAHQTQRKTTQDRSALRSQGRQRAAAVRGAMSAKGRRD